MNRGMKTLGALGTTLGLLACGGGGGGGGSADAGGNHPSLAAAIRTGVPAGVCPNGGITVDTGIDTNGNGVLDPSEVTNTQYVCNGEPGAGLAWEDVTGTSVNAISNTGYLAHNDLAPVTVTLPAAPQYGDIVQVTGVGAGGWVIAQNDGQSIISGNVLGNIGARWTTRDSARRWDSLASSADGTVMVAGATGSVGDYIYVSNDSGAHWTAHGPRGSWSGVAVSADGTKLVAVSDINEIQTSVDGGVNWTARETTRSWKAVASSADGTKLVAVVRNGQIYTSGDSGANWTAHESARTWQSVASSADGTKLVAANYGGYLYTSNDSGATWTARGPSKTWYSVASSADGTHLAAATYFDYIYTSDDSGLTWTSRGEPHGWYSVACSADGTRLVAAAANDGKYLYTSANGGLSWSVHQPSGAYWRAVASSADGTKLAAVDYGSASGGFLYTSTPEAVAHTSAGTAGSLIGGQYDAVDLQYIGDGMFVVRNYAGYLEAR